MGNERNLKPVRTREEAQTLGKKGGVASGAARREKRHLRQRLELLLHTVEETSGLENADVIAAALVNRALTGDIKAFEVIRDTIGEKPTTKVEHEGTLDMFAVIKKAAERAAERAGKASAAPTAPAAPAAPDVHDVPDAPDVPPDVPKPAETVG